MNVSKPAVRIRTSHKDDLGALVDLENRSFVTDRVSRAQFRRHLDSDSAVVLVAEADGRFVGSALVFLRRGSRRARLYSIAIDQHARGMGVGGALFEASEAAARERGRGYLSLEVREDNAVAIRLYESRGYVHLATLPGFYEDGATARRYEKTIA